MTATGRSQPVASFNQPMSGAMRHPICQQRINEIHSRIPNSRVLTRLPQEPSAEISETGGGKLKQLVK